MKKLLQTIIIMLMSPMTIWAEVGDVFMVSNVMYKVTSESTKEVEVVRNNVSEPTGDLVIPSSIGGYSVTGIGARAFSSGDGFCPQDPGYVTSINIPASVKSIGEQAFGGLLSLKSVIFAEGSQLTSIGNKAFQYCLFLQSIVIPEGVKTIGENAFYECNRMTSIYIPASVESISNQTFYNCMDLKSIVIPESVKIIGEQAFSKSGLTSVTIPEGVKTIGSAAFYECFNLTSITIPANVTSIGENAFSGCVDLTSINVDKNNPVYDSRGDCNAIIETQSNTLICGCKSTFIPNSVTSIGEYAFSSCFRLTSIKIPNSVTSIGEYAFSSCSSLTSIEIPNSVTSIGGYAFSGCI